MKSSPKILAPAALAFALLIGCRFGDKPTAHDRPAGGKPAQGGGGGEGCGTGNCGGDMRYFLNPWFIGHDPVKYCIEWREDRGGNAKSFSIDRNLGRKAVERALEDWRGTVLEIIRREGRADLKAYDILMATDVIAVACGDPAVELKFKFGTGGDGVEQAVRIGAEKYAISLVNNDAGGARVKARNNGVVWVAPDGDDQTSVPPGIWARKKEALLNVLLHEVGHVYGFQHDDSVLMNIHLARCVVTAEKFAAGNALTSSRYLQPLATLAQAPAGRCFPIMEAVLNHQGARELEAQSLSQALARIFGTKADHAYQLCVSHAALNDAGSSLEMSVDAAIEDMGTTGKDAARAVNLTGLVRTQDAWRFIGRYPNAEKGADDEVEFFELPTRQRFNGTLRAGDASWPVTLETFEHALDERIVLELFAAGKWQAFTLQTPQELGSCDLWSR